MTSDPWPDFEEIMAQFVHVGIAFDPSMLCLDDLWREHQQICRINGTARA